MRSWGQVLGAGAGGWEQRRDEIGEQGEGMASRLAGASLLEPSAEPMRAEALDEAVAGLRAQFDSVDGGWGRAPKFPQASVLEVLLRRGETPMSLFTPRSMAGGGGPHQGGRGCGRRRRRPAWTDTAFRQESAE